MRSGLLACIMATRGFIALTVLGADEPAPALVSVPPNQARPVEIVSADVDEATQEAKIVLKSAFGIFAFDFHPPKTALKKVTLVIRQTTACEGLTFSPAQGRSVSLIETPGFAKQQRGEDLVIELTGKALELLGAGGRVQFIDRYR